MQWHRVIAPFVLASLVLGLPTGRASAAEPKPQTATGTWVGLRGGPPKLRTALAAALQTQASIRGMIDRAAVDLPSLEACRWSDVECFVALGERHDSRVILVGDLSRVEGGYKLKVARINVERGQVIAESHLDVARDAAAIDTANRAIAGLTAEVVAVPTEVDAPDA